jgi:hypothetical protein
VKNVTEKWFELARKSLEKGDEEQYSWPGTYNNKSGHVVLSKEKLLFVEERGFIHTSADLLLEISYDKINTIRTEAKSQLEITTVDGMKRSIATEFPHKVKSHLEQLMKQAKIEVVASPAV